MTNPRLLLPLRIPELGPSLGKLVTASDRAVGGISLAPIRLRLVTRVLEAAGEARRLSAHGERIAALGALGPGLWLDAWEEAVAAVSETLVGRVNSRLAAEATAVRMPRRLAARLPLDDVERRALGARLGSTGAPLIRALDRVEAATPPVQEATALERAALEEWQAALAQAGRRLEASWLALEEAVEAEATHWAGVGLTTRGWRRSLRPVLVSGILLMTAATWLGLILGGYLAAPSWLERLWAVVFS